MNKEVILRCWQDWTESGEGLMYSVFDLSDKGDRSVFINEWDEFIAIDKFTGMHDKNNKHIFENDIVLSRIKKGDESYIGVISWDQEEIVGYRVKFDMGGINYNHYFCGWYEYHVIGTKLNNPELLKLNKRAKANIEKMYFGGVNDDNN